MTSSVHKVQGVWRLFYVHVGTRYKLLLGSQTAGRCTVAGARGLLAWRGCKSAQHKQGDAASTITYWCIRLQMCVKQGTARVEAR